jgi:glycolate oxidase
LKQGFNEPDSTDLAFFIKILDENSVFTDGENRINYGHDETEDLSFPPAVVLKPSTTSQVAAIARHCNERRIALTTIGARTGLSGGALSVFGGVGMSMERFNKIVKIDELNQQVTVEPGVITQVLQEAVAEKGLYYAPDPASRGSCSIGGNLAENSGGPHAVKYGVTKDFVLNLEVVLASGDVIWTGANTLKNSTGYNLTQLMVGSEGTLGIITKAVLKLLPLPRINKLMLIPFASPFKACEMVAAIFKAGLQPSALEFMERDAIDLAVAFTGTEGLAVGPEVQAHLLVEMDGNDENTILSDCEQVAKVAEQFGALDILFADNEAQKAQLWNLRRKVGEAVKSSSVYKEEDTVVPRYELPVLLEGVKSIGRKYGFHSVCYGHAGDGNLHVNILRRGLSKEDWESMLPKAITEIFELTISLGGTLSGEHGIGLVQKEYMNLAFGKAELQLQRSIKYVFDSQGILNPGKMFPEPV